MERVIRIDNKRISFDDVGKGRVIVFLHGWMDSKRVYEGIISELSKTYRCISIDLPGFGKSDSFPKLPVTKLPHIINRLIRKLDVKHFYLVGHSLGGSLSILYAKSYPYKIKKVVLISPFVTFKQFSRLSYFGVKYVVPYVLTRKIISPIFKLFKISFDYSYNHKLDKEVIKRIKRERVKRRAVNAFKIVYQLSSMDIYKLLRRIRRDVLIVYGTKDPLLSMKPLETVFGTITNIHLAIFEDARHFIPSPQTHELAKKIDLFFKNPNVK